MSQSVPDMLLRQRPPASGRRPEQEARRTRRQTATALAGVPLFAGFSKKDLERLADETDVVTFKPGQAIVEEGMLGETMFVILSGEAVVMHGRRRLGTVRPGDHFGELAAIDGAPRSATVVAVTPVTANRLFRRTLFTMLKAEPQLSLKILDAMVVRIRDLTSSLDA
jgi:CRP/FNR family transcriptional regulator, cyclic AMP receptor protein